MHEIEKGLSVGELEMENVDLLPDRELLGWRKTQKNKAFNLAFTDSSGGGDDNSAAVVNNTQINQQ